jgi:hypothetical protein
VVIKVIGGLKLVGSSVCSTSRSFSGRNSLDFALFEHLGSCIVFCLDEK